MEEVSPWSNLEPLKCNEVDFRPLHKPQGWHLRSCAFLLFYHSRALTGEENEQAEIQGSVQSGHHILSAVFLCPPSIYPRYVRSTQRKGAT